MKMKQPGFAPFASAFLSMFAAAFAPGRALAEPTRELRVSGAKEILEGDPESASVDAQGRITVGLTSTELGKASDRAVVSLASGASGSILAGTAGGGVLQIQPSGESKVISKADDKIVSAIVALGGETFLATNPDGRVAALLKDGGLKTVYDPPAKYVWSILADGGDLLVATGQPGQVVRVAKNGNGAPRTVFDPGETHVRALIRHPKRGLIAGGGQRGVVYQLSANGTAFALFDSELEEVTAFAVDDNTGDLYAAFVSESKPGALVAEKSMGPVQGDPPDSDSAPIKGSDVVRISPSGRVELVWTSKREGALALAFDTKSARLFIATGAGGKGRGRVYAVDARARDRILLAARTEAPVASALLPVLGGGLIMGTSPAGRVLRIGPGVRSESVYVSAEQDLASPARIGRLWFDADVPPGAKVEVTIRSGNTKEFDKTWSAWSEAVVAPDGGSVKVPEGRYVQLRARLAASSKGEAPMVKSMHASVVRMNVAPTVEEVFALRRGVYMSKIPPEEERERTVTLSRSAIANLREGPEDDEEGAVRVRQGERPGMASVAWRASDANNDGLVYRLEAIALDDPEATWQRLADGITETFFSFDTRAYRDGRYRFRVTASDRPANPPDVALTDKNESEPFTIDNSPPRLKGLRASAQAAGKIRVELEAEDDTSWVENAELSVDGGPWLMLPATDGMIDAKKEALSVEVGGLDAPGTPEIKPGRHTVSVRVEDAAGNAATASTVTK